MQFKTIVHYLFISEITMKRIGLLCSGADAPGMNAFIRSVIRSAEAKKIELIGISQGFKGLVEEQFKLVTRMDTANIVGTGGTILKTGVYEPFMDQANRTIAALNLKKAGIDGLIGCGGIGLLKVLHALAKEHNISVVGAPATIDNDIYGTDYTIGYDTALNTAADAIDRIRDTAESEGNVYIIEVMGSEAGYIAINVGIGCGAEYIAIPETITNIPDLHRRITTRQKNKRYIIVIGEGDEVGGGIDLANILKDSYNIDSRVAVLGALQKGGRPSIADRVLASRLGSAAIDAMLSGNVNAMVGVVNGTIQHTPLPMTFDRKKILPDYLVSLSDLLA